jgi:dTDP-4-amino-4,6-dideoxygalactose transaminase
VNSHYVIDRWSPHPRYRLYTSSASYTLLFRKFNEAVEQFEREICARFNVAGAVCVPMARTGIYLALLELIQPGQKVIMSPLTIIDVVNAVLLAGGIPVFCDIDRETSAIDPDEAESLIDGRTGAVLITHLHGHDAGSRVFRDICRRRGVAMIEDAAQAFGAVEDRQRLGTIGDAGIYSFSFFKNLSTWRGGMVVSNNRKLIAGIRSRVRKFSHVSMSRLLMTGLSGLIVDVGTWPPIFSSLAYPVVRRRFGFVERRLDPEAGQRRLNAVPEDYLRLMRQCQAAIGLRHIEQLDADTRSRITHAKEYHAGLDAVPKILKPRPRYDFSNIYTYFPVQMPNRPRVLDYARKAKRDFAAQHLRNCADLAEFREFYRDCSKARAASRELILLPTYPRYPVTEVQVNVEVLKEFVRRYS